MRKPAKKSAMIGWKKFASAAFAPATPVATRTTGMISEVTNSGMASLIHSTTTAPSSASTVADPLGGQRPASINPVSESARRTGISSSRPSSSTSQTETASASMADASSSASTMTRASIGTPSGRATTPWSISRTAGSALPTSTSAAATVSASTRSSSVPVPLGHGAGATR
jgi:hypothetical protein